MTQEYFARLAGLSLAAFFLVHLASGLGVVALTTPIVRLTERLRPRMAARILLALRFVPIVFAAFSVAALCVPSYLWLEPDGTAEQIGWTGSAGAVLTLTLGALAVTRAVRITIRSRRWAREEFDRQTPVLAIAGIFRPRIVVSPAVREQLTPEEMAVSLRHEEAHRHSLDNLKRLLIAFAPGLLPGWHGFSALERHWRRFAEWAADDDAVRGDNARSLALASALVRMARLRSSSSPLAAGLLDGDGLTARVDRLLDPRRLPPWETQPTAIVAAAGITAIACAAALAVEPANLQSAHDLLERLIR